MLFLKIHEYLIRARARERMIRFERNIRSDQEATDSRVLYIRKIKAACSIDDGFSCHGNILRKYLYARNGVHDLQNQL